ncbi:MAG TPA: hypothetical protein VIV40_01900 [Kofleriaceae bacterium]
MAHRSKKKHLKHMHQHEAATPKANSPVVKARAAAAGIAKKGGSVRRAPELEAEGTKKQGIVRRLAAKATKKITAKPRRAIARAKARVKSLLA